MHLDIISCHNMAQRRLACRETWLAQVPDKITYQFIVGEGEPIIDELDTVQVDARDTYECLLEKVLASIRLALQSDNWEWYCKVDDDTYVDLPRLVEFLEGLSDDIKYTGLIAGNHGECYGGAGYFMRREVAETIIRRHDSEEYIIYPMGFEDAMIGRAANDAGYTITGTNRLCQFGRPEDYPTLDNDRITCHMCNREKMQEIYKGLHPVNN